MNNQHPGAPNDMTILSFSNSHHGRTFGTLSCTNSANPLSTLDIPRFDWPVAPFPQVKYPFAEHEKENRAEEDRCLAEARKLLKPGKTRVVGMIIEPIQGANGNYFASPYFYKGLRTLCNEFDIPFIVDEVNSGVGSSGKMWAHEHWGDVKPDIVTFAKKMQVSGYYTTREFRPKSSYQIFNTWMGDPLRLQQCMTILNTIRSEHLVQRAAETGDYMMEQLTSLQKQYPIFHSLRGQGTLIAYDFDTRERAEGYIYNMINKGINVNLLTKNIIRLRPSLVFGKEHADIFLEATENTLREIS